jgi:hypothetical protein
MEDFSLSLSLSLLVPPGGGGGGVPVDRCVANDMLSSFGWSMVTLGMVERKSTKLLKNYFGKLVFLI